MNISDNLSNFLETYKLFQKCQLKLDSAITQFDYPHLYNLQSKTFKFFCKDEKQMHTFELQIHPFEILTSIHSGQKDYGDIDQDNFLNASQHFRGVCKSCNNYSIDIIIKIFSDQPIPVASNRSSPVKKGTYTNGEYTPIIENEKGQSFIEPKIYLMKIGQFPPYEVSLDKELRSFLIEEDTDYYKKALMNISYSYGIGAFAYFRRILENEIKNIIHKISEMDYSDSEKVKAAYEKYLKDHVMSTLIETANKYLPSSLKDFDNILNELYAQLSVGLHGLNDEECMERAVNVDKILRYVIKELNTEKNERAEVKKALNDLRKFNK